MVRKQGDNSAIKSTACCFKGLKFDPQHQSCDSKPLVSLGSLSGLDFQAPTDTASRNIHKGTSHSQNIVSLKFLTDGKIRIFQKKKEETKSIQLH